MNQLILKVDPSERKKKLTRSLIKKNERIDKLISRSVNEPDKSCNKCNKSFEYKVQRHDLLELAKCVRKPDTTWDDCKKYTKELSEIVRDCTHLHNVSDVKLVISLMTVVQINMDKLITSAREAKTVPITENEQGGSTSTYSEGGSNEQDQPSNGGSNEVGKGESIVNDNIATAETYRYLAKSLDKSLAAIEQLKEIIDKSSSQNRSYICIQCDEMIDNTIDTSKPLKLENHLDWEYFIDNVKYKDADLEKVELNELVIGEGIEVSENIKSLKNLAPGYRTYAPMSQNKIDLDWEKAQIQIRRNHHQKVRDEVRSQEVKQQEEDQE